MALTVLDPDPELVSSILDEMLTLVDADGIMQVGDKLVDQTSLSF